MNRVQLAPAGGAQHASPCFRRAEDRRKQILVAHEPTGFEQVDRLFLAPCHGSQRVDVRAAEPVTEAGVARTWAYQQRPEAGEFVGDA